MALRSRTALAITHVPFEDLGLLEPILHDANFNLSYCNAPMSDFSDPGIVAADLLIVLGGPIGVYEVEAYPFLAKELALLERRLSKNLPTLGICLGAQLIAKALGARVFPGPVKEIGWGTVDLTSEGRSSCLSPLADDSSRVLHWHGDTFDLPSDAVRLASNKNYENQAFAHHQTLALQFHLEADPECLEQWYVGHAAELAAARVSVPDLREATAAAAAAVRAQAKRIFTPWLRQVIDQP